MPTYHLANIVDDHLMEISHVIRGKSGCLHCRFILLYIVRSVGALLCLLICRCYLNPMEKEAEQA